MGTGWLSPFYGLSRMNAPTLFIDVCSVGQPGGVTTPIAQNFESGRTVDGSVVLTMSRASGLASGSSGSSGGCGWAGLEWAGVGWSGLRWAKNLQVAVGMPW